MVKKHILTNTEIEKDIITALKNPPKESEASNKKSTIIAIIIAVLLVVIEFIYPIFIIWFLLALITFLIVYSIFNHIRLKNRIKNVTIDNYYMTTEIVHSITEEHYRTETGGSIRHRHTEQVNNYIVRFEKGKSWRVPKELYNWDEKLRRQDLGVYNTTYRGDTMIVVTEKSTGAIIVAYNTDIFEYKN